MDVSNIGALIRLPIELLGKVLYFILNHFIEIGIVIVAFYLIRYLFNSGIIKRLAEAFIEINDRRQLQKLKGGKRYGIQSKEENQEED